MKSIPKVSIVTPVFNSSKFLIEAIQSVENQTYQNWEMIMVDDCSTDNSIEIIESMSKSEPRLKLIRLAKNCGSGIARNKAIHAASGQFIAFLDSDDIWHKQKLEKHVNFMITHNAVFSHTAYGYLDEKGEKIRNTFLVSHKPVTYEMLLKKTEISCLTAMYDQSKIGKFYMPSLRRKQDYGLWLSILKKGHKSLPLNEELAYYRQRKGSSTNNKWALILKHYTFLRTNEGLNPFKSIKYTLYWVVQGLKKYYF